MFTSNAENKDFTHPISTSKVTWDGPSLTYPLLLPFPKKEWITSGEKAVCIDMDCDGGKKILVKDIDGSLTKSKIRSGVFSIRYYLTKTQ